MLDEPLHAGAVVLVQRSQEPREELHRRTGGKVGEQAVHLYRLRDLGRPRGRDPARQLGLHLGRPRGVRGGVQPVAVRRALGLGLLLLALAVAALVVAVAGGFGA